MANNLQKGSGGPMRLYVGSLHCNITKEMLRGIFEPFGKVEWGGESWLGGGRKQGLGPEVKDGVSSGPFSLLCLSSVGRLTASC